MSKLQRLQSEFTSTVIRLGLAAFFVFGLGLTQVSAQQTKVTGTVTDASDGSPLPGVNIIVKGTTVGTSTNGDGQYSLNVPSANDTLLFSFVGYITQQMPLNGRSTIDITLKPNVQALEDVVVVGYGTQRQKEVTSSVSSVKPEDFKKGYINNPAELVQGKVAGLSIANPGADPNGDFTIRLRGLSTIGASTEPLVVVDGVPGASLNSVDPNDIASVDVLKDASASAIYGTRGASGVILITTKSGEGGPQGISVEYNGSVTLETVYNKVDVMSPDEYRNFPGSNDLGSSTNWFDQITRDGISDVHNLALSGGSGSSNYRVSVNYRDARGIEEGTGFDQLNGRLNFNQRALDDRLNFNLDLSATNRDNQYGFSQAFRYAALTNPTQPVYDPQETQFGGYYEQDLFDYYNPVSIVDQNRNEGDVHRINGSLRAEYDFSDVIPGLNASGFYSIQQENGFNGEYYSKFAKWQGAGRNGLARRSDYNSFNRLFEGTLNYLGSYSNLNIEGLAGYSYQQFIDKGSYTEGGNFLTDKFSFDNMSGAQDFANGLGTVSSYKNTHKLIAFFGRLNLNWDDTYFLSASLRHEGSTRFGTNNKWGDFPAVSGGIEVTELIDIPYANQLKARFGFGITGQDAPQSYLSLLRFGPRGNFLVNGSFIPSYGPVSNANPDLQWETKTEYNWGFDFAFFDSRLSGSLDYYVKNTKNLLFDATVPVPPNLFDHTWLNLGNLRNNGFEASLSYTAIQKKDFTWKTGGTFSTYHTVLESLSNDQFDFGNFRLFSDVGSPGLNNTNMIRVKEGEEIGQLWGPKFTGIDSNGKWQFEDVNGDGQIDHGDDQVIGNGLPDFSLGWTNDFNYKNWSLSFFFRGDFGHNLVNTYRIFYENPTVNGTWNILKSTKDVSNLTDPPQWSSYYVEDGSYVKLDNLSIGYSVPLPEGSPVKSLRVDATGKNLLIITGYSGVDPAVRYADPGPDNPDNPNPNALAPGIDRRDSWFNARAFTLGVNVRF